MTSGMGHSLLCVILNEVKDQKHPRLCRRFRALRSKTRLGSYKNSNALTLIDNIGRGRIAEDDEGNPKITHGSGTIDCSSENNQKHPLGTREEDQQEDREETNLCERNR